MKMNKIPIILCGCYFEIVAILFYVTIFFSPCVSHKFYNLWLHIIFPMRYSLLILILSMPFVSLAQVLEDEVYEENIQSVQLYPRSGDISGQINAPVVALGSNALVLEFDDLAYEPDRYAAEIIHCNADWTQSGLKPADYLQQFNEYNLNEYEYSINTRVPYIHFTFKLPRVSKSGNYILRVYRKQNEEDILTRRFMVYDSQFTVGAAVVPPSQTEDRNEGHQVDIQINYAKRGIMDALNNVKVIIRQNQRWDHAKIGLKPTFIREDKSLLEYRLFDGSNVFPAGNEFRFVDLRYVRTTGRNIAHIEMKEDIVFAETGLDRSRNGHGYVEYLDLNGQYMVHNLDRANATLEGEYVLITFYLEQEKQDQAPFVFGALSNWGKAPGAQMEFDGEKKRYEATLLLKQGWYDYQYAFQTETGWDIKTLESSHFQTENEYEVLVYYRELGSRYDELLGYSVMNVNRRRF